MSVQTEISRLESAKEAIATAIAGKGVTVPDGTMLDGMAALIESIEAGGGGGFPNGTEWTQSNITSGYAYSICYGNGKWVASTNSGVYASSDGKNWVSSSITSAFKSCAYGKGVFVTIGSSGVQYSADGVSWSATNLAGTYDGIVWYVGGKWFSTGSSTSVLHISDDGISWKQVFNAGAVRNICWYGTGWLLSTVNGLYYSTNGTTWTRRDSNNTMYVTNENGIFVRSNTNKGLYYSIDGTTWTQSNITTDTYNKITNHKGVWLAIRQNNLVYSNDGKYWYSANIETGIAKDMIGYANGVFVCGGMYNKGALFSTDGVNWTASSIAETTCYSALNENGIWVMGTNTGLYYSVTWEPST